MTVERIIEGCRQGEADARKELYERYAPQMYGVIRRYVRDASSAEDLLHDGFITLYTKIGDWRGDGPFEAWCRRIFVNTALSWLRKNAVLGETEEISEVAPRRLGGNEADIIGQLSADDLKRAVDSLPDGYKTVLNLYAVEGYSHAEIAEMLGISGATSRSQYLRAKSRLAAMIEDYYVTR